MQQTGKCLLIGLILLVPSILIAIASERPTGFGGLTWGTEYTTVKDDLVYWRTDPSYGGIQFYLRNNDQMVMGEAKLDGIEYGFWQKQFYGVNVFFSGSTNFSSIKASLFERFGPGSKPDRSIEEYFWFDFAEASISIEYSEIQKRGIFRMFSKELTGKAKRYQTEKNKEGPKKDFDYPSNPYSILKEQGRK
jgi:hypothetical protein